MQRVPRQSRACETASPACVCVAPLIKSLGKRLDSILCDIARLPLSPPIEELLARLEHAEGRPRVRRDLPAPATADAAQQLPDRP